MSNEFNYRDNFIKGVQVLMSEQNILTYKDVADIIGIGYQSLNKIVTRERFPTVEQCLFLCKKAGYSANWLFLNVGEMMIEKQNTLNEIAKEIKKIRLKINNDGS